MALETAQYINGLVVTNPASTDPAGQGDDHLRLIKNTLKNTFPGVTGPITATHTEMSKLAGLLSTTAELNKLNGVTATTTELNKLSGLTASTAEMNKLTGLAATTSELNKLNGVTVSTAELNKLSGLTTTAAKLNYVDDVTSAIQAQINTKAPLSSPALTGTPTAPTPSAGDASTKIATTAFVSTGLSGIPLKTFYESPATVIALDTLYTFTHGLSVRPKLMQAVYQVKVAFAGYSVGDEIPFLQGTENYNADVGPAMIMNATQIKVKIPASAFFRSIGLDGSSRNPLATTGLFDLVVRAWL